MDSMVMDVRQRDLFIQALTDRLEEAKVREAWPTAARFVSMVKVSP